MARNNRGNRGAHTAHRTPGKKGQFAMMAGAALGGIAGAAVGGMAGAFFSNRQARERASEVVGYAGKYATNALDAVIENQDAFAGTMANRGRKGGHVSRRRKSTPKVM